MKRLALTLAMVWLLALAACDTMGPQTQEIIPTDMVPTAEATTGDVVAPTPAEGTQDEPVGGEGSGEMPGSDLTGVTWEWSVLVDSMGQTEVTEPTRYTAVFNSDGTLNLVADCNIVNSTFVTNGFNIEIMPGMSTLVACEEGSQDQLFVNSLNAAESYTVEDNELFITLAGDSGTMIFRTGLTTDTPDLPSGSVDQALTGTTWEWVSTSTGADLIDVADPTRYTITFSEDGNAAIKADCNNVIASYETGDNSSMTITLGPSTLMACPDDSQVDLFLAGLPNIVIYSFIDGDLVLDQPLDSGSMRFRAAGTGTAPVPTPAGESDLTGISWEWVSTTSSSEEIVATDPTLFTIVFFEDGTAGIKADCNVGNAEYTAGEDGTLTITLGIFTLAFCEDSQDTAFREGLTAAAAYSVEDDELLIELSADADAATMRFRAGGTGTGGTGSGEEVEPTPSDDSLTGVTWQWVSTTTPVEEITIADPTLYTIMFNEDGTAGIKADCNVGNAEYTTGDDGTIAITLGVSTLAFCADSQDQEFRTGLEAAAVYFFQDGDLFIDMFAGSGTMRFTAAPAEEDETPSKGQGPTLVPTAGLTGTSWQLNLITKRDGNITVNDPSRYTITFNADGSANITADCNVVIATYTTGENAALTITPGPSTMAFCGLGSLDQIFVGGLTNAMSYAIEEGNLVITMLYESGTLVFSPAG